MALYIPAGYVNLLGNLENTEKAIKAVKDSRVYACFFYARLISERYRAVCGRMK